MVSSELSRRCLALALRIAVEHDNIHTEVNARRTHKARRPRIHIVDVSIIVLSVPEPSEDAKDQKQSSSPQKSFKFLVATLHYLSTFLTL